MPIFSFIWTNENMQHVADHDITPEEAEYVVENANESGRSRSKSSGSPIAFAMTENNRSLAVVYEVIDEREGLIFIVTAYDVGI